MVQFARWFQAFKHAALASVSNRQYGNLKADTNGITLAAICCVADLSKSARVSASHSTVT